MRRVLAAPLIVFFLLQGVRAAEASPFVLQHMKAIEPYRPEGATEGTGGQDLSGAALWAKLDPLQNPVWHAVAPAPSTEATISGEIPAPFRDESSWAKLTVRYSKGEDEGDPYVRLDIRDVIKGWQQMRCDLPPLDKAYHFRLRVKARAEAGVPVTIGLRQTERPWQYLWIRQLILDPSWKAMSFDFVLGPVPDKLALYVSSNDANKIDFNRIVLEAGEVAASPEAKGGKGEARNLLRVSRFPLGVPPGANLDRDAEEGEDITVRSDASAEGLAPSGGASLFLKSGSGGLDKDARVIGQPFVVNDFQAPYTASLAVKGKGRLGLRLVENGVVVASRGYPVDSEKAWQRVSLRYDKFKPDMPYQLEVAPQGALWVGDWQVAEGEGTAYLSENRPEIALAATAPSRIYLEGDPARIRYQVTGAAGDLLLRAKVVDLYGRQRFFEDVPLKEAQALAGEMAFDAFPDQPFGAFRVEAWLVDRSGKVASEYFDLPVLRVRRPRHLEEDAPDSPFGVHTSSPLHYLGMAKRIGINWVRLHDAGGPDVGWSFLEPKPGEWQFQDADIRRYRSQHLLLLGELGTAPAWATNLKDIGPHNSYWDRYYQPNNLENYGHYVQTMVDRYRNDIAAWDVWNEPWNHAWWATGYDGTKTGQAAYQTSKEPQKDFVSLSRMAYRSAKQANPQAVVLGVNATVAEPGDSEQRFDGTSWTKGFVEAGGLDCENVISFHNYTSGASLFPGDTVEAGMATAFGPILAAVGKMPKPVWMTEGSPVSGLSGVGFYNQTLPFPFPENIDATSEKLCRYVLSNLANGVRKVFLYSMHTHNYLSLDTRALILASEDGSPHPSAAAFANMTYWIEGKTFSRRVSLRPRLNAYVFEGGGQTTTVFAAMPDGKETTGVPDLPGMAYYDLYGNALQPGASSKTIFYGVSNGTPADEFDRKLKERFN